jgi:hypothetical protein
MIDYILAVQNPPEWHAANIDQNRHHYSSLAYLGPQAVDRVAERIGVGVHFNTLVRWRDRVSAPPWSTPCCAYSCAWQVMCLPEPSIRTIVKFCS